MFSPVVVSTAAKWHFGIGTATEVPADPALARLFPDGYVDDPEPFKTGISYGDPVAGVHAVGAISLALLQRHRTGAGCYIDLAQRQVKQRG